jgi:hypothetical protein
LQYGVIQERLRLKHGAELSSQRQALLAWHDRLASASQRAVDERVRAAALRRERSRISMHDGFLGEQPMFVLDRLRSAEGALVDGLLLAGAGAVCVMLGFLLSAAGWIRGFRPALPTLTIDWRGWFGVIASSIFCGLVGINVLDAHGDVAASLRAGRYDDILVLVAKVAGVVLSASTLATAVALRQRRQALGLAGIGPRPLLACCIVLLSAALVGLFVSMATGVTIAWTRRPDLLISGGVIALAFLVIAWVRSSRSECQLHVTYLRSAGPMIAAAGLAVAVLSVGSRWAESNALAGIMIEPSWLGPMGPAAVDELRRVASQIP